MQLFSFTKGSDPRTLTTGQFKQMSLSAQGSLLPFVCDPHLKFFHSLVLSREHMIPTN